MRHLIALLVASSLLAGCQIGEPSAEQRLHELRVACINAGREWNASTGTCVTPPTATAIPAQVVEWKEAWWELIDRRFANVKAGNDIQDRIQAGLSLNSSLDEFKDLRDEFASAEGAYGFVIDIHGGFPRFPEVRVLNDRIFTWAESFLNERHLYIRFIQTRDRALFDQVDELRIANNVEWMAIKDAANDFLRPYGYNNL